MYFERQELLLYCITGNNNGSLRSKGLALEAKLRPLETEKWQLAFNHGLFDNGRARWLEYTDFLRVVRYSSIIIISTIVYFNFLLG